MSAVAVLSVLVWIIPSPIDPVSFKYVHVYIHAILGDIKNYLRGELCSL